MEELESALAARYQQAHVSNTSINGNIVREQASQITAHFGVNKFTVSDGWIDRFKRGHNTFTELQQMKAGVLI
jgi:centromere protein B